MSQTIASTLTEDHRRCDRLLAEVEGATARGDWATAQAESLELLQAMEGHFRFEEEVLFPPLESSEPMARGPTGVMRSEHRQIRVLLGELAQAAQANDRADTLGLLETLHYSVQQHNAKEEGILYPLADRQLGDSAGALLARLGPGA
jgi:iron-sulfur cluster repair protein YtfE (RIC family)